MLDSSELKLPPALDSQFRSGQETLPLGHVSLGLNAVHRQHDCGHAGQSSNGHGPSSQPQPVMSAHPTSCFPDYFCGARPRISYPDFSRCHANRPQIPPPSSTGRAKCVPIFLYNSLSHQACLWPCLITTFPLKDKPVSYTWHCLPGHYHPDCKQERKVLFHMFAHLF